DRLAIMRRGAIEQLGRPEEIFEEPATEYVAEFIGMSNRLTFERRESGWTYEGAAVDGLGWLDTASSAVAARARSEDVHLAPPGAGASRSTASHRASGSSSSSVRSAT